MYIWDVLCCCSSLPLHRIPDKLNGTWKRSSVSVIALVFYQERRSTSHSKRIAEEQQTNEWTTNAMTHITIHIHSNITLELNSCFHILEKKHLKYSKTVISYFLFCNYFFLLLLVMAMGLKFRKSVFRFLVLLYNCTFLYLPS